MKKLNTDNNGFSVFEFFLVIVTLVIIGVAGYFVAKHIDKNSKPIAPTSTTSTNKVGSTTSTKVSNTLTVNPYNGWHSYTSKLENVTIKYPTSWAVTSNGNLSSILNNTAQEEDFSVNSPTETLSTGTVVQAEVSLIVSTSGSGMACNGLVIHYLTPITVSGRQLSLVSLDSYTQPGEILGIYVTDEQGLKVGGTTSNCQPSFASLYGNSNVSVFASFITPLSSGSQAYGTSIQLTSAEYNGSSVVQQAIKVLESLTY